MFLQKHEAPALPHSRQSTQRLAAFEETLNEGRDRMGRSRSAATSALQECVVLKNETSQLCLNAPTATRESATPLQI